jgi:hypothetical protein
MNHRQISIHTSDFTIVVPPATSARRIGQKKKRRKVTTNEIENGEWKVESDAADIVEISSHYSKKSDLTVGTRRIGMLFF